MVGNANFAMSVLHRHELYVDFISLSAGGRRGHPRRTSVQQRRCLRGPGKTTTRRWRYRGQRGLGPEHTEALERCYRKEVFALRREGLKPPNPFRFLLLQGRGERWRYLARVYISSLLLCVALKAGRDLDESGTHTFMFFLS